MELWFSCRQSSFSYVAKSYNLSLFNQTEDIITIILWNTKNKKNTTTGNYDVINFKMYQILRCHNILKIALQN